ncbi:S-adenosyl-L-methionine-dependent methyltransferase [Glomus cerebriforme]|uniref:S-adenosyl-L-methionine-dependent methyltransferase n=1 Tax=Glomus cerebriforme TaxID=658196 RepID=A0A397T0K5_9GLOM|nr:S-adenosyl-L-methionine-dependent methyltransferase [Glomus cerebriforme]
MISKVIRFARRSPGNSNNDQLIFVMDEKQVDRLQIQHHLFRAIWGENFNSPIKEQLKAGGFHVLEVGCGPGTWICDMATDFPTSIFVGVDIVSTYPTQKPTNITFSNANLLTGLPFSDNTFDFVRMSSMVSCFTEVEWRTIVMDELLRVLKPGGYLELEEGDAESYNRSPSFDRLVRSLSTQFVSRNMDPIMSSKFREIMEATGSLTNIENKEITIPIGSWGGKLGTIMSEIVIRLFDEVRGKLIPAMNIRPREYDRILESFRHEMNVYKTYARHHRFHAMKTYGDH